MSRAQKYFDFTIQILLAFLPWATFFSVFLTYKLNIPGASFIKEGLLLFALIFLCIGKIIEWKKEKKFPLQFTWIDIAIFAYTIAMVVITLPTTGIRGLVYGGRYDFAFLFAYLLIYHGYSFLKHSVSHYLKIFVISAGLMLFVSGLLKFPLSEDILFYFGYSGNISAWQFGGAPPAFHGIDGANVRRFQGLLDGPNSMGAFLILYMGILVYYTRYKKDWYFLVGAVILVLIVMILYTYSRSALIAMIFGFVVTLLFGLKHLYHNYKKQVISIGLLLVLLVGAVSLKYSGKTEAILGREGSTKGHAERMIVGIDRFLEHPLGQGMGSSGPAYRYVLNLHDEDRATIEEQDRFYIPESWYIQQFVEGGAVGGTLFLIIMATIFIALLLLHPVLGGMFAGLGAMNFFLHTFESSVIALSLFLIVGMLIAYGNAKKHT